MRRKNHALFAPAYRRIFTVFAAWVALSSFTGCYTLQHRLKDTFKTSNGIFVPVFDNQTEQVGAEKVFTNALIRELSSRREVLLTSRSEGGLELKGTLTRIKVDPTAQSDLGFKGLQPYRRIPSEIGVWVNLTCQLEEKDGKVVWKKEFSGFRRINATALRTYNYEAPSSQGPITQSLVELLFADIAPQMMRDVYDEMVLF